MAGRNSVSAPPNGPASTTIRLLALVSRLNGLPALLRTRSNQLSLILRTRLFMSSPASFQLAPPLDRPQTNHYCTSDQKTADTIPRKPMANPHPPYPLSFVSVRIHGPVSVGSSIYALHNNAFGFLDGTN